MDKQIARALIRIDQDKYGPVISWEKGKPAVNRKANRAIYRTLNAAILAWKNLTKFLVEELDFRVNNYNRCVANKMIKGKQCTIALHVDNLKLLHIDPEGMTDILKKLYDKYGKEVVNGKEMKITATCGKVHEYLGMTINFLKPNKVMFSMYNNIYKLIKELPDNMKETSAMPSAPNAFEINHNSPKLDKDRKELFHHLVTKTLFLLKQARLDLQTTVLFLCTRVQLPTKHDWHKPKRMMKYLQTARHL